MIRIEFVLYLIKITIYLMIRIFFKEIIYVVFDDLINSTW